MNFVLLWTWPVLVCLGAWLFRRWVVRQGTMHLGDMPRWDMHTAAPGQGFPFRMPLPYFAGNRPKGFARALLAADAPAAGRLWLPRLAALLSHWRGRLARKSESDALIEVLARRAVGPQQQVLIVRAGGEEHTVLLQTGMSPLLLSSQRPRPAGSPGGKPVPRRSGRRQSRSGMGIACRRKGVRRLGDGA